MFHAVTRSSLDLHPAFLFFLAVWQSDLALERERVDGILIACWEGNHFFLLPVFPNNLYSHSFPMVLSSVCCLSHTMAYYFLLSLVDDLIYDYGLSDTRKTTDKRDEIDRFSFVLNRLTWGKWLTISAHCSSIHMNLSILSSSSIIVMDHLHLLSFYVTLSWQSRRVHHFLVRHNPILAPFLSFNCMYFFNLKGVIFF